MKAYNSMNIWQTIEANSLCYIMCHMKHRVISTPQFIHISFDCHATSEPHIYIYIYIYNVFRVQLAKLNRCILPGVQDLFLKNLCND